MLELEAIKRFRQVIKERHQYARDWKAKTGGKVIGFFCTYVPEEIIYASGTLPVRIMGNHEPESVTAPYIYSWVCSCCRDSLAQGLEGKFNYIDGLIIGGSCIHMAQAFHAWRKQKPVSYSNIVYMPSCIDSRYAKDCYVAELAKFKRSLEGWVERDISEQALDRSIEVYNTNRRLMKEIYRLRLSNNPTISGAEAMEMVLASQVMDKNEHNRLLQQALEELPKRKVEGKPGIRLMILGSENDDTEFVRLVESLGANVVIDDHCTGSRYFWNEVVTEDDQLSAIAARYIDRPRCPDKDITLERRRLPHILKLAKDYRVEAVILILQKFCDHHEWDMPLIQSLFKANNIPTILLEFTPTHAEGQLRTRIEALLEMARQEIV